MLSTAFPATRLFFLALLFLAACRDNHDMIRIPGLKDEVEVIRDTWGVNHIYAKNQRDLFFTQGYCAAKDRLFQFELWRRQATGTMSEILGEKEFNRDLGARLFKYRGDIEAELNHYHPDGLKIINAFTEGVNAYIKEVNSKPEQLPVEFKLLNIQPELWTPEIVISRHQGILTNVTQELNIGRAVELRGSAMVKELIWFHPNIPNIDLDTAIKTSLLDKDILAPYTAMKRELVFNNEEDNNNTTKVQRALPGEGSNNWIIASNRSASGFPMLANDPHRKIGIPSLRYLVHLVAPGWNVSGAGEPTIPGVSIGHNEFGAWGLTIFETDNEDLYVYNIDPLDPSRYFYNGRWEKMIEISDTISIRNSTPRVTRLRFTIHGPVTFMDTVEHKAFAVRAAWLNPGGAPYLSSLRLDQAKNWKEFREACSYGNMPAENMIWADRDGNTGWQVVGLVPIRNNFSGYVPVPGDGRYEWNGFLPIKDRPSQQNPKQGFFVTANEHVTPSDYTHWNAIGYTWSDPYRGDRIRQVLSRSAKISVDDMAALQHDKYSMPASELVPLLKNMVFKDPETEKARLLLMNWDYNLNINSIAAGIYVMWENELMVNADKEFIPEDIRPYISLQVYTVIEQLKKPVINFGIAKDLSRDEFIRKNFQRALLILRHYMGSNMRDWQYGQIKYKHVYLAHPISSRFNIGPAARGGNSETVQATGSHPNQNFGASFSMIADTKDWDQTLMINTPGQSADPRSKYYDNLFHLWASDKYFPAYFSRAKIESAKAEYFKMGPE